MSFRAMTENRRRAVLDEFEIGLHSNSDNRAQRWELDVLVKRSMTPICVREGTTASLSILLQL